VVACRISGRLAHLLAHCRFAVAEDYLVLPGCFPRIWL
jgi:hypothetical protein